MSDRPTGLLAEVTEIRARADTLRWLQRAVIGLNLCPFAKAVHVRHQIHHAVYLAHDSRELIETLLEEAHALVAEPAAARDTTLLIAPNTLHDFIDFNDLTTRAERHLARAGFDGVLQLASFHPLFEFAGSAPNDIANATNRAPYPTLHLLREDSVSRAVEAFPEAEAIFGRNIVTLEALGQVGWAELQVGAGSAR